LNDAIYVPWKPIGSNVEVNRLANRICRQNSIAKIMASQKTSRSTAIYTVRIRSARHLLQLCLKNSPVY